MGPRHCGRENSDWGLEVVEVLWCKETNASIYEKESWTP
jgi:hypothetical protein